jgi:outer membrane protein assembly factor BamB
VPPKWVWAVLAVLAILQTAVRGTEVLGDHAFANIATVILASLAAATLLIWFVFLSGYRRRTRVLALACFVAGLVLFAVLFRVKRVSGELVPTFALRFSATGDRALEPAASQPVATASVDLRTTTEDDFPQFLGPLRSAAVEHVALDRDWATHPPQLVWRQEIGSGWSGFSVVNGHAVTMEQRGDQEMVTCYELLTGRLEWAHSAERRYERLEAGVGPRSTPTIHEGKVYALGAMGHLMCLDGAGGKLLWEKGLVQQYGLTAEEEVAAVPWGRAASPLVVGGLVIVPAGGRKEGRFVSLMAVDRQSGNPVWEGGDRQISYSSPSSVSLAGINQVLIVNEDTVSGHDVTSGKPLWEHPWKGRTNADPNVSQAVAIPPDRVLVSKGYGQGAMLLQLQLKGDGSVASEIVWKNSRVLKTKFTNVAVYGGYVYGLSDGILECVELAGGRSVWKSGRYGHGQLLRVHDLLLVLSEKGEVVLVEATPDRGNSVLGRFQAIDGLTWNNFALCGPYLLVRNAEQAACYHLPLEGRP